MTAPALPPIMARADLPKLGLSRHGLYAMVSAGELDQIAPGYYLRPGELDDTTATWASRSSFLAISAAEFTLLPNSFDRFG